MYTIRNVPSGGMEGLQIINGKVSQLRTDLGEFQIHDFSIYFFFYCVRLNLNISKLVYSRTGIHWGFA